jgi:hypothetical protein
MIRVSSADEGVPKPHFAYSTGPSHSILLRPSSFARQPFLSAAVPISTVLLAHSELLVMLRNSIIHCASGNMEILSGTAGKMATMFAFIFTYLEL